MRVMSPYGILSCLVAALFLGFLAHHSLVGAHQGNVSEMVPLVEQGRMEMMVLDQTRRKLGSFQICALCTCCGGARGICLPSPCCYAINCNIPNRPFGDHFGALKVVHGSSKMFIRSEQLQILLHEVTIHIAGKASLRRTPIYSKG
ncbi:hypothetical protein SAY87_015310 [Trapa incisa]|uniref:DUF7866 domain-containing protein n=1 Tax=Trapa incisa TaxID=236973 RepID=A0AAN7H0Y0_9MYRT|nr:hypothetical protein SAY87_015310 [Trapa incisa]